MNITFLCKTNCPDAVFVNLAKFKTNTGRLVSADRDATYWSNENQNIVMVWANVYLWDGEHEDYQGAEELKEPYAFMGFEIEDDAPAGYSIKALEVCIERRKTCLKQSI